MAMTKAQMPIRADAKSLYRDSFQPRYESAPSMSKKEGLFYPMIFLKQNLSCRVKSNGGDKILLPPWCRQRRMI
jgi:hypothetical protein